jgi:two-component system sensor histidine kinase VicK
VAAIRVFGETLAEGGGDAREYGALLAEESERLEALVERVLAATRLDEAPRFTEVRPGELLASVVRLMRPRAARRGVTLRVRADEGPGEARWDEDAVRAALLNLIDNAIKHGRQKREVDAVAEGDGQHVRLSVRDDGPGIGRRDQRRIFGRFARGTTRRPAPVSGSISSTRSCASTGDEWTSRVGRGHGCLFTLVLPGGRPRRAAVDGRTTVA